MTITEFLEARISEDVAIVHRRGSFPHSVHLSDIVGTFSPQCADCAGLPGRQRTLAEAAAKRAIIAEHPEDWAGPLCVRCRFVGGQVEFPCTTIRAIAAVYADHPDYLPEWTT